MKRKSTNKIPEKKMVHNLLRVGLLCNAKCVFCNVPVGKYPYPAMVPNKKLKEMIREFASNKSNQKLTITGGEPLVRKDLVELISYASSLGIKDIEIQTNGLLLANNNYVDLLKKAGLKHAFVSFHSTSPKVYDELMGVKKSFFLATEGIENLLRNKIRVNLNIVTTSKNYKKLPEIIKFIAENFSKVKKISLSVVQPRGSAFNNKKIIPSYDKISPYIKKCLKLGDRYKLTIVNPYCGVPFCIGNWHKYLNNCVEYKENKKKKSIIKGVSSADFLGKVKMDKCSKCKLNKLCNGVWQEYADVYGFSALKPIK